jgi:chemotaxis signal transduction protein
VPPSYDHVEGLIDYRGTIYPVFNLGRQLGVSKTGPIGFTAPGGICGGREEHPAPWG